VVRNADARVGATLYIDAGSAQKQTDRWTDIAGYKSFIG
jgi:hypothetical protein